MNDPLLMHKKLRLITEDNKVNKEAGLVEDVANGWKKLTTSYRDPIHGMCTTSMFFKENESLIHDQITMVRTV